MLECAILAIGNELLYGWTLDTNSHYLSKELTDLGYSLKHVLKVRDDIDEIVTALEYLTSKSTFVIISGGLGPTSDDLTREAIAKFCKVPAIFNETTWGVIQEKFLARNRPINPASRRQAYFPEGGTIIKNNFGTADALSIKSGTCELISLPGVPKELKGIFSEEIIPRLKASYKAETPNRTVLRTFGPSESWIGSQIDELKLPTELEVSYRPHNFEVILTLSSLQSVESYREIIKKKIGEEFIISNGDELSIVVSKLLATTGHTIAIAESCSGGILSNRLVSEPGASTYFLGSVVAYANQIKESAIGVPKNLMQIKGAVSKECAEKMAKGIRFRFGSDIGVSITGIAGPSGGTPEKPVGTFFVGISYKDKHESFEYFLNMSRDDIRFYSTSIALDLIRRVILNLELTFKRV